MKNKIICDNERCTLEQVGESIDWSVFRKQLQDSFPKEALKQSRYDILLLFKITLLQHWYGMSDSEIAYIIFDRLSFRRFLGLDAQDETPDESTIEWFRVHLMKSASYDQLFKTLQTELDKHNLVVNKGVNHEPQLLRID